MPYKHRRSWRDLLNNEAQLLATPWTAAYQAPPSMGFSRQEYWRGVPLPSPKMPPRLLRPWDFPGKSTGEGCHCLLRRCLPSRSKSDLREKGWLGGGAAVGIPVCGLNFPQEPQEGAAGFLVIWPKCEAKGERGERLKSHHWTNINNTETCTLPYVK